MLASKKRAAKWGCRTGGIASLAYWYHRTKINFKWIQQLKWRPGKSTTERRRVSYTFFLLSIHPGLHLFLIMLAGKGLWKSSSRLNVGCVWLFPVCPSPVFGMGSLADWEMAFTLHITRARWRGAILKGGRGRRQISQGSLLQAKGSKEWRGGGIALWRVNGSIT